MRKCVVVGISGCVAAFKAVQLVSDLVKLDLDVEVIMTKNACEFIQPLAFEALTNHTVMVDTFDHRFEKSTQHISIAKKADCFIIAPATANVIAKIVHGQADDMLTTTFLACQCPKLIAPAMNTAMFQNPITQDNLKLAKHYGIQIIEPISGHLACGDAGMGKLADLETLKAAIDQCLHSSNELAGKKVIITAGATMEAIDPVRFITNHSSGKMGCALARQAQRMGADVTLIHASMSVQPPQFIKTIYTPNAAAMAEAIKAQFDEADIVIKAAAVSDYRCAQPAQQKIKKASETLTLQLVKNEDILAWCGAHKTHQLLIGFAMETENVLANARKKRALKNCDLLVANSISESGAGFQGDTNRITILSETEEKTYDLMSKDDCAAVILKTAAAHLKEK
ncbi:bifunctional phosphopantothenoylcysteine decarboxylase/phosphopantothenate--cysteine ligase CoaBC [Dielma fastidiosa]|uniref:Coenzyme A biosynthesis bifunctional protein CoaBC n=1 Tax=Dielma fastidiosa TaxID=1034346 RepID=A0AB35ULH5_9FIRM|nr:bifunctional phosphopantothenoylcysteine decarboxylase/phosphopantothenate--cysteine ligase CoaBC [Dielma fastidiosa]MDY5167369.1 bifunctional phosphopantothenoylcysteine decarboxylase/phosphopantothenate--cysteine ligase CoaBC [Dielma fastidiosa]